MIFKADPYYVKLKFNEPLVDGGPQHKLIVNENASEYWLQVGKMNYKQHFTNLENP